MTDQSAAKATKHIDTLSKICGHANVFKEDQIFQEHGFPQNSSLQGMVMPGSPKEIAEIVHYANRQTIELVPVGGGTQIGQVSGSLDAKIAVNLRRLDRIHSFETDNLSITLEAGVLNDQLQRRIMTAKLQLPVPADCFASTIGGEVAANSSSWKRTRYGAMEDYVLGAAFISPQGKAVKTGGSTVKNVSGYDFNRMLCGSWGTFGILHTITLKLVPLVEKEVVIEKQFSNFEEAFREGVGLLGGSDSLSSCNLRYTEKDESSIFVVVAALEGSSEFVDVQLASMQLTQNWQVNEVGNNITFGGTYHRKFRSALKSAPYSTVIYDRRNIESILAVISLLVEQRCSFDLDMSAGVLEFTLPKAKRAQAVFRDRWVERTAATHGIYDNVTRHNPPPLLERLKPAVDPQDIMFSSNSLLGRRKRD